MPSGERFVSLRRRTAEWFLQLTPVGWEVRNSITGEESGTFGGGKSEYHRAKAHVLKLNNTCEFCGSVRTVEVLMDGKPHRTCTNCRSNATAGGSA